MTESQIIEYKRELSATFEGEVVAFLNSKTGGHIYVGIDDDGSIYGVKNPDLVQRQVADRILNNIRPATLGLFDIIPEERETGQSFMSSFQADLKNRTTSKSSA